MGRWPGILWSFILAMALIGTSPAGAQNERLESMKVELAAAWFEEPEEGVLLKVAEKEQRQGFKFTPEEIALEVEKITGQMLKRNCFTCRMRALTPGGYVPLSQIKVGDILMSWDESAQTLVPNQVAFIHKKENQPFGIFAGAPTGVLLEVSGSHPFLLGDDKTYARIDSVPEGETLRGILQTDLTGSCEGILVLRAEFAFSGLADLITLSMARAPYNFVVEGFVVHNKWRRFL